jgi:glycosyltransferase involved in cell wall biosynthesis
LAQSISPYEILIVDASDTDQSYVATKDEFHQNPKIKYIHSTSRSGLSADRNTGIRHSSGDVILFLDDDTVLEKGFIKEIVRIFEEDSGRRIGAREPH